MARIILYYFILLLCISSVYSVDRIGIQPNNNKNKDNHTQENVKNEKKEEAPLAPSIQIKTEEKIHTKIENKEIGDKKKETIPSSTVISKTAGFNSNIKTDSEIESGAVVRGIFVFIAITMLFIIYIAFKTIKGNKKNVLIKKYGVRTQRTDLEMEPLPLDDDEEDETVFDLGHINNR